MFTMLWHSRLVKRFWQIQRHAIPYLTVIALSCVLLQAQQATNYIVGYWEGSGTPNVSHLTHLNYAFASVSYNGSSYSCQLPVSGTNLTALIAQFRSFKVHNPKLKILISVGGAGQNPQDFTNASKDPNFATNCVSQTLGQLSGTADGIDIDWEFPSTTDPQNFTNLMSALHTALPANDILTAAVGMGPTNNGVAAQNANVPFTSVLSYVNLFNVMTYGSAAGGETTFNAPLFAPVITNYGAYNGTIDTTINDLITNHGVPPGKIVLGIPFYGISYPDVPAKGSNDGIWQVPTAVNLGQGPVYDLAVPYNQIAPWLSKSTVSKFCDTGAATATACPATWGQPLTAAPTGGSQETWIYDSAGPWGHASVTTFDDKGSMAAKVKYALQKELGGVMAWELMQDTSDNVLLNAIASSMPPSLNEGDPSTYNFESTSQGWTTSSQYASVATSKTQAFLGTSSLSITVGKVVGLKQQYSPSTLVYVASPAIQSTSRVVVLHIWIPAAAKLSAIDPFIADSHWTYLAGAWTSTFTPNAWNTFEIQIPANANPAYLGVEFDSTAYWATPAYLDSVDVY